MAAAVVNAPLGSARIETSKGGTIASFAESTMSIAIPASRPATRIALRLKSFGLRGKITSCTRLGTSCNVTLEYGTTASNPAS